jgi:phospholipid/cholesterol/gamma-HCH transport system substrate-binding protein
MAQSTRSIEIGTGLFVLLGFVALGYLTTQLPGNGLHVSSGKGSYSVTAEFDNVGGLKVGAPVSMAGVQIGEVTSIAIDPSDYRADVQMAIQKRYANVPDDSNAAIETAGLLGANYVALTPGGSDKFLHQGSQLAFTQSALVLENIVNKFFANTASGGSSGSGSGSSGGNAGGGSGAGSDAPPPPTGAPGRSGGGH